jgi:hypothetical protein
MTYDALKLSDRQILDVLALAREERALVMVHAENADCIGWLTQRLELAGRIGRSTTPPPVRRWSSARPPTGRSPSPSWPRCRS